jgi:hypothetical protein
MGLKLWSPARMPMFGFSDNVGPLAAARKVASQYTGADRPG